MSNLKKALLITSGGSSNGFDAFCHEFKRACSVENIESYALCGGIAALKKNQHEFFNLKDYDTRGAMRTGQPFPEFTRAKSVKDEDLPELARMLAAEGFGYVIVAGGDGSLKMYSIWLPALHANGIRTAFVPGTIDGDILPWKKKALGTSSAKDGSSKFARALFTSHRSDGGSRMFLADCMGRDNGTLALAATIGAGGFGFILPEETESVPEYAFDARRQAGLSHPEQFSFDDLVHYLGLSHLKVAITAQAEREKRFTVVLGEGVCARLGHTPGEVGKAVTGFLREAGVDDETHYKVSTETIGYGVVRITPSNSVDCELALEYAWRSVNALVHNHELPDILVVPEGDGFTIKSHSQVYGTPIPHTTTKIDLSTDYQYRTMARARGERMLFTFDLENTSMLDRMFAFTRDFDRDRFNQLCNCVAWLGDTKETVVR